MINKFDERTRNLARHAIVNKTEAGRLAATLTAGLLCLFFCTGSAQATERQLLQNHAPNIVKWLKLQPTARLSAKTELQLAIGLRLRNPEALASLLDELYDPASPLYHRYLTPEEFTESFGPTEEDYEAVIAFAEAHNLRVTARYPNRVLLDVSGSVADIERMFQVNLLVYQHPGEARTFYA